jgi:hypothetical protein
VVLGWSWHLPKPSQTPVVPQVLAVCEAHSLSGSTPAAMFPQAPLAPEPFLAAEHASHDPLQALLQQTPSTQKPLPHWPAPVQAVPLVSCGMHAPARQ